MAGLERAFKPIIIGIEEYDDPFWKTLPEVSKIAARVAKALGAESLPLPRGGAKSEALQALKEEIKNIPERATLFIHWIGHGVTDDQHYLICRDSPPPGDDLDDIEAVASGVLGRILANSRAERVVVVLDTCFSGEGAGNLAQRYRDSLARQLDRDGWERVVCVIAASHPLDKAVAGRFSQGLAEALEQPDQHLRWSRAEQYIDPETLAVAVKGLLGDANKAVHPRFSKEGFGQDIIPNPLYKPEAGNADIETSLRLEGVFGEEAHFNLSSRGIETGEAGYFFSGRRRSQEQIINWLNGRHASLMVVTGPPGAGKSALLGRVVTLSVPEVRAEVNKAGGLAKDDPVPPDNSVDVAVYAKRKNVFQVATALGHSVGLNREIVDQAGITDVLSAIKEADTPLTEDGAFKGLTIVIDALDEAGGEQAQRIANELIRPLAKLPNVRLLVGTRRSLDGGLIPEGEPKHGRLVKAFGPGADILDLENEPETQADIAEFVAKRLRRVAEDQRGSDPWIEAAAAKVASAANGSFLYARLVARSLEAAPGTPLAAMPADANAAFVQDIAARFPGDQKRVTDMLRAIAFTLGLGLSRAVWGPVATALDDAGDIYDDDDVIWMLRHVGSYIVETTVVTGGIGQAVYRLIHQALADHLQGGVTMGHTRIVDALCRGLEGDAWLGADLYLRRHLVDHAVFAEQEGRSLGPKEDLAQFSLLELLIATPGALAISEPASVLAARKHLLSEEALRSMAVYMLAADKLHNLATGERWSLLHLTALMQAEGDIAEAWTPPKSSPWRALWAKTSIVSPHFSLPCKGISAGYNSIASLMIFGPPGREKIVARGDGYNGPDFLWDAQTGRLELSYEKYESRVGRSFTAGVVGGRAVVVSFSSADISVRGYGEGIIRLWDVEAGKEIGEQFTGIKANFGAVALGEVGARAVIALGCSDGTVRLWDVEAGKAKGNPFTGHTDSVVKVALGEMGGRDVIVSVSDDGTLRLWDVEAGTAIVNPFTNNYRVTDVAVLELGGRTVIASFRQNEKRVRLWDPAADTSIDYQLTVGPETRIFSVAFGKVGGRAVIVSGSDDRSVRLWDAKDGTQIGNQIIGHKGYVTAVALGEVGGQAVIVSAGLDATVRLWDLEAGTAIVNPLTDGHKFESACRVTSVSVGELGGREVIVSGSLDNMVRLWNASDGTPIGGPLTAGGKSHINSVALGDVGGRSVIACGKSDGSFRLWVQKSLTAIGKPHTDKDIFLESTVGWTNSLFLSLGEIGGRAAIITGRGDTVQLWSMGRGNKIRPHIPINNYYGVNFVALAKVGTRSAFAAGSRDNLDLYDAKTSKIIKRINFGYGNLSSFGLAEVNGQPLIVAGSFMGAGKGAVTLSNMITGSEIFSHYMYDFAVRNVVLGGLEGRALIVLSGFGEGGETLRLISLDKSSPCTPIQINEDAEAIALCRGGRLVVGNARGLTMIELRL